MGRQLPPAPLTASDLQTQLFTQQLSGINGICARGHSTALPCPAAPERALWPWQLSACENRLPAKGFYCCLLNTIFFLKIQQLHSCCSRNCRQVQITSCTKAPKGSWSSQARGSSGDTCMCCARSPLPAPPGTDVLTRVHSVGAARGGAHSENPAGTRSCPRLCCSPAGWYPGGSCAVGGSTRLPQPLSCGAVPGAAVLRHGLGGERRAASLPPHPACATAGCCSAHRTRYRAHVSFACKEPHYSALINHDRLPFFSKIVQQLFKHTSNENFIAADLISCRPVVSEQVGVHPEPTQAATRLSCC